MKSLKAQEYGTLVLQLKKMLGGSSPAARDRSMKKDGEAANFGIARSRGCGTLSTEEI
jgi:hypothetical protein